MEIPNGILNAGADEAKKRQIFDKLKNVL